MRFAAAPLVLLFRCAHGSSREEGSSPSSSAAGDGLTDVQGDTLVRTFDPTAG